MHYTLDRMKRPDPTELALDRLSALRAQAGASSTAMQEIKGFLKNRSNLVVARAAKLAGELRMTELVPDLLAAFDRLMKNPAKLDKGCAATAGIVGALYEMDYAEPEIYLAGIHHVQMEGSFGPPVDVAAKLRGLSALGLARTRFRAALDEIVTLLVDPWPDARVGGVRALVANGGEAGALLLKLKILTGENEPDVLAECFSGLLEVAPERSLPLVAKYIDSEDLAVAEAALLAIGSSHRPEALQVLREKWETRGGSRLRKTLLLAIAMIRSEEAVALLVSLLEVCAAKVANDVLAALAIFRENEKVRRNVEAAVSRRNDRTVSEAFRTHF
jgi:HEAT repeat protein